MKRKISESEVSLTINLKEKLGGLAENKEIVDAIGQDIIDVMLRRTQEENRDVNGKLFPKYSKSYKDSLAFKSFGKSNDVNLTLTGDMLSSLTPSSEKSGQLTVSVTGSNNIIKAFANITGDRGGEYKSVKRDFFGISEKDLDKIINNYKPSLGSQAASLATSVLTKKILQAFGVTSGQED